MKNIFVFAAAVFCCFSTSTPGAETARARVYCLSLEFQQGDGGQYGLDTLDLTTLSPGVNGELAPLFGAYSHWSRFELYSFVFDEVFPGTLNLNTPAFADLNGNGFDDFFEVSRGVGAASSGIYAFSGGGSTLGVTANWSRAAGSAAGTCTLNLQGYGSFAHTFGLIEYTGPLSYTPGSTDVTGAADLVQTGNPAGLLRGPVRFVKSATNHFNQLALQPGVWTNGASQLFVFHNNLDFIQRDLTRQTNYHGYVDLEDGDLNTGEPDYVTWYLSIDDVNDYDHDGIPDFSDDPLLPRPPMLTLKRGATDLLLTIGGDIGRLHQVQEVGALSSTNWLTVLSVTLTNDPQTVSLPLPSVSTKYWRVRAQ